MLESEFRVKKKEKMMMLTTTSMMVIALKPQNVLHTFNFELS